MVIGAEVRSSMGPSPGLLASAWPYRRPNLNHECHGRKRKLFRECYSITFHGNDCIRLQSTATKQYVFTENPMLSLGIMAKTKRCCRRGRGRCNRRSMHSITFCSDLILNRID